MKILGKKFNKKIKDLFFLKKKGRNKIIYLFNDIGFVNI